MSFIDFSAKRTSPFQRTGVKFREHVELEEFLTSAKLDYEVLQLPVYARNPEGFKDKPEIKLKGIPNTYALVRDDNGYCFTTDAKLVTGRYSAFQNADMYEFIASIQDYDNVKIATAGQFRHGERVFCTVELGDVIDLGHSDIIERYLLITNKHDGRGSIGIRFVNTRVVCENTLNLALSEQTQNSWKVIHTLNKDERIDTIRQIIYHKRTTSLEIKEKLEQYKKITIQDKDRIKLLSYLTFNPHTFTNYKKNNFVFGSSVTNAMTAAEIKQLREVNAIIKTIDEGVGQEYHRGTLLHMFNGIACYYQNVKTYRDSEEHFNSVLGNDLNNHFENQAIEFVIDQL